MDKQCSSEKPNPFFPQSLGGWLVVVLFFLLPVVCCFPVGSIDRPSARRTSCISNLKQIGTALTMYVQDYDDHLPLCVSKKNDVPSTVPALLHPYLKNTALWRCPSDAKDTDTFDGTPRDWSVSYGYNWLGLTRNGESLLTKDIKAPDKTIAFGETDTYLLTPRSLLNPFGGSPLAYRHQLKTNVAFLDGHVRSISPDEAEPIGPASTGISEIWHLP